MSGRGSTRGALGALAASLVCAVALAQDAGVARKVTRDAARDGWTMASEALRVASRVASDARAAHQALVARERARAWFAPSVRAATHEAALVVVTAEHLLADATAGERLARLRLIATTNELVEHLERVGADPAAIDSELQLLEFLGRDVDLPPPERAVPAPARDPAALARLAEVQLEALVMTFEDLAHGADRRARVLEAMRARSEGLLERMERRWAQGVACMATPVANQRLQRDRLVAWKAREVACAAGYRGYVRDFQAELDAREARRRSSASPAGDG